MTLAENWSEQKIGNVRRAKLSAQSVAKHCHNNIVLHADAVCSAVIRELWNHLGISVTGLAGAVPFASDAINVITYIEIATELR